MFKFAQTNNKREKNATTRIKITHTFYIYVYIYELSTYVYVSTCEYIYVYVSICMYRRQLAICAKFLFHFLLSVLYVGLSNWQHTAPPPQPQNRPGPSAGVERHDEAAAADAGAQGLGQARGTGGDRQP